MAGQGEKKGKPSFLNNREKKQGLLDENETLQLQLQNHVQTLDGDGKALINHENHTVWRKTEEVRAEKTVDDKATKPFRVCDLPRDKVITTLLLLASNFLYGSQFSLMAPFFPQEAAKKGASTTIAGFVFSFYQVIMLITVLIFGSRITRIGPRFLFTTGQIVAGISFILFGLLNKSPPGTTFIVLCFLCRGMEAVGCAAFATSGLAVMSWLFPSHLASVVSLMETSFALGLLVGPAIGGLLYGVGGYGLPFYLMGAICCLCGAAVLKFCLFPTDVPKKSSNSGMGRLLTSMSVWVSILCMTMASLTNTFTDPTLALHLQKFHLSESMIGLAFLVKGVLYVVTTPVFGIVADKLNFQAPFILLGCLGCVVAFLLMGPTTLLPFLPSALWLVLVGLALQGLCMASVVVPAVRCMAIGARELGFENNFETFGLISGIFNISVSLGSFVGPLVGGILVEHIGFRYSASCMSLLSAFTMVFSGTFFLYRGIKRQRGGGHQHVPLAELGSTPGTEVGTKVGQMCYGSLENGHLRQADSRD